MLFRVLLALVTGLLVARPFVLGEDPGLLVELSDPGGLVLTLLWFLGGTAWAAWRLWAGQERVQGGLVEVGWLGVVVMMFVSAAVAAVYKHPAWLIAWEWLALVFGFVLVRQLFTSEDGQQGLLTALLATCVALSITGIFQGLVELPPLANKINAENPVGKLLRQLAQEGRVFSTFAHSSSFAGYLVLLLPALFGAVYLAISRGLAPLVMGGAVVCAGLGCWALWLTQSRGALLALGVAGGVAAALAWRRWLLAHRLAAGIGIVVLAGAGFLADRQGWLGPAAVRLDAWKATWAMIEDHPWLGVGPGNFEGAYPRYLSPQADGIIQDPHNLVLEIWATAGPLAVAFLALAVVAFFLAPLLPSRTEDRGSRIEDGQPSILDPRSSILDPPRSSEPRLRWEFYLGGMLGLLLGFLLRVGSASLAADGMSPGERILGEGVAAAIRSLFWFTAFAILERIDWPARLRGLVLTAGVGALLLHLLVSSGIGFPSVAGLLLAVMALALNAWGYRPLTWLLPSRVFLAVPVPVLAALTLIYFATAFYPVTASAALTRSAIPLGQKLLSAKPQSDSPVVRALLVRNLKREVIPKLQQAAELDPGNARIALDLAWWLGRLWVLDPREESPGKQGVAWAEQAILLDPESRDGYQTVYQLRRMFAYRLEHPPVPPLRGMLFGAGYEAAHMLQLREKDLKYKENLKEAREQQQFAAEALARYADKDPFNPELRFLMAEAWFRAGEMKRAREQAVEALKLDNKIMGPGRKLSAEQRHQLGSWFPEDSLPQP